jgi:hypothetical protein
MVWSARLDLENYLTRPGLGTHYSHCAAHSVILVRSLLFFSEKPIVSHNLLHVSF